MITQDKLQYLLNYNPDTGVFVWLNPPHPRIKKGQEAGTITESGYRRIMIEGKPYFAHRLAWLYMFGSFPKQIDHINANRSDNIITNLRESNCTQNARNGRRYNNNTSGANGVKITDIGTYEARIRVNGHLKHLGTFYNIFDAVCARKSAEKLYGFEVNHGNKREVEV
jgi:hypothetical protein